MKKWLIMILMLIVVIGGVSWYFLTNKTRTPQSFIPTVTVQKGDLQVAVSGSGSVEPVHSEDIVVKENKEINEVLVAAGDEVKAGQEILTFSDDSDPLTAPFDGVITTLDVSNGDRVSAGKSLGHITNYTDLQTTIQIDELDISKVKLGQVTSIKINAYPELNFNGKVTSIANEGNVSNGVSTFDVEVHIDQPESIKVGMTTEANIIVDSKTNALFVPVEAVHGRGDQKFVLVREMGEKQDSYNLKQVPIETGIYNEDNIEITSGLTEGDILELPAITVGTENMNGNSGFRFGGGNFGGVPGMNRGMRNNSGSWSREGRG